MTDVQAALGLHQLPHLDEWIERRAAQWQRYDDELSGLPLSTPPSPTQDMHHARHLYQIEIEPEARLSRDEVLNQLHARKIGAGVHYRGVHLHPYYRDKYALDPRALPIATRMSERTISLPLSPRVTTTDQGDVVASLKQILTGVE